MFEQSLISDKMAKEPRRRKTYLSLAFLLHGAFFTAMLFFQYWSVEALPAPPIQVGFFTAMDLPAQPPSPAPRPAAPVNAAPAPAPPAPVQPQDVPVAQPVPVPDAPAETIGLPADAAVIGEPVSGLSFAIGSSYPVEGGQDLKSLEQDPGILQVGGAVTRPVAIRQPQPRYTDMARRVRLQGQVVLEAIIDKNGDVQDVTVRRGLPYGLSEEAMAAVRQWKFEPATLGGKPVAVFYNLTVRFALQ